MQLLFNLLQQLPPEKAHAMMLWAFQNGLYPRLTNDHNRLRLPVKIGPSTLYNPIGLAAGADKNGVALPAWEALGLDYVEVGTVRRHPHQGNPSPRLWRIGDNALVNWMGLPSLGMESVLKNLRRFREKEHTLSIGVSIASPDGSLSELRELAASFRGVADYIACNISCPNLEEHEDESPTEKVKTQVGTIVEAAKGKPVMVKLGPFPQDETELLLETIDAALEVGATGFIACNTIPQNRRRQLLPSERPINWPVRVSAKENGIGVVRERVGGYSGPELLPTSTRMVKLIREYAGGVPIIGVGGIQSAENAISLKRAGADAIQLYTGLVCKGLPLLYEVRERLPAEYYN